MTLIRLIAVALGFGFAFGAMGANTATPAWKRGIEHQRQADLGDGTFLNPVLAGDRPDPSVLKDGETTTSRCRRSRRIRASRCGIRAT